MSRTRSDEGLIIKKTSYPGNIMRVVIFTKNCGKLVLFAHGVQKLTSRRISHIEIGNYLKFSYYITDKRTNLNETEMQYGHINIKGSIEKLSIMYDVFFVLEKLLPEGEPEIDVFEETKFFLKVLNNKKNIVPQESEFFRKILIMLGYINSRQYENPAFDEVAFIEDLIGKEIRSLRLH